MVLLSRSKGNIPFSTSSTSSTTSSSSLTTKRGKKVVVMMDSSSSSSSSASNNKDKYEHNDGLDRFRWTARESFRYMYGGGGGGGGGGGRPWRRVSDFYYDLIQHHHHQDNQPSLSFSSFPPALPLFPPLHHHQKEEDEHRDDVDEEAAAAVKLRGSRAGGGRWERLTFKILLSYHGPSFDGWQKQPSLNTVQGLVEKILGRFVDDRKAQQLREKSLPVEGCAMVAGRTDKGVTALQQVCSFYTWNKDVNCKDIMSAINDAAPGKLRAVSVTKVSRVFHPNFTAKWRRYLYIFPLDDGDQGQSERSIVTSVDEDDDQMKGHTEYMRDTVVYNGNEDVNSEMKPRCFRVSKVNELLQHLEGKTLSYKMFARDTKASRSIGPPTECFMFHARAAEAYLPCLKEADTELRVMCVELVANRFLRKMVRVLVATAMREAAAGANDDALLKLMDALCRRATAPPAPPDGLCLVDVGYRDFEREVCFIQ